LPSDSNQQLDCWVVWKFHYTFNLDRKGDHKPTNQPTTYNTVAKVAIECPKIQLSDFDFRSNYRLSK